MPLRQRDGKIEALRRVPALSSLSPQDLKRLAGLADVVELPAGAHLMVEGRAGHQAFLILDGEARILRGATEVARLGQGQFVGEMALVYGQPRSATVITATPTRLLVFGLPEFRRLGSSSATLAHRLLAQLGHRLRSESAAAMVDQS